MLHVLLVLLLMMCLPSDLLTRVDAPVLALWN